MRRLPAHTEATTWHFEPAKWPRLVRSTPARGGGGGGSSKPQTGAKEVELVGGDSADDVLTTLPSSKPRDYQVELFRSVMECERNSLVYLPNGLGKTLVAGMVLKRLLELNPGRQAFFLVETTTLAVQQVKSACSSASG